MTVDEFLRDPVGHFVRRPTFTVWCLSPTLCGTTYRGWPNEPDLRTLFRLLAIDAHPRMHAPFDVLTDTRLVEGVDAATYDTLSAFLRGRLPDYAHRIRRNAVVRPEGVVGSTILGVYAMLKPAHAWAPFASVPEALAWLNRPDAADGELARDLARLSAEGDALIVGDLRALLAAEPKPISVGEAATLLGASKRTLQRALHEAGVTFQAEALAARLARAHEARGAGSVANGAGYASRSGFWKALRRATKGPLGRLR